MMKSITRKTVSYLSWMVFWGGITYLLAFDNTKTIVLAPHDADEIIIELIKVGMENRIIADSKGKIVFASASAAEITGYTQNELKGLSIDNLIPERYLPRHKVALQKALKRHDGKVVSLSCLLKRKNEAEVKVEIRTRVKTTSIGELILVTITQLSDLEEDKKKIL